MSASECGEWVRVGVSECECEPVSVRECGEWVRVSVSECGEWV